MQHLFLGLRYKPTYLRTCWAAVSSETELACEQNHCSSDPNRGSQESNAYLCKHTQKRLINGLERSPSRLTKPWRPMDIRYGHANRSEALPPMKSFLVVRVTTQLFIRQKKKSPSNNQCGNHRSNCQCRKIPRGHKGVFIHVGISSSLAQLQC